MLNISELHEFDSKKEKIKNEIYEKILIKCHNKIKLVAKNGTKFCWYETPEIIIGQPYYNVIDVTIYMKNKLIENGLKVNYYNPNILYISWNKHDM